MDVKELHVCLKVELCVCLCVCVCVCVYPKNYGICPYILSSKSKNKRCPYMTNSNPQFLEENNFGHTLFISFSHYLN